MIQREAQRWVPPADFQELFPVPHFVEQRFGPSPANLATNYVSEHFALGCSCSSIGPEDKVLTLNFAGGPKQPMLNYFLDGRNDPYGQIKQNTGASGHAKAHHLTPFVASKQSGSTLLFVSSFDSKKQKKDHAEVLYSHLDLPADCRIWSGDGEIVSDTRLDLSKPIFLRYKDVVAAIQVLIATAQRYPFTVNGQPVKM